MTIVEEFINIHENLIYSKKIKFTKANKYIIFLHEGLGCTDLWKDFPEKLCKHLGYNGFMYDRRGYGRSSEHDFTNNPKYMHEEALEILPKIIDYLSPDEFLLYGHSDGGTISLIYGVSHNQKPKAIITEAAHSHREEVGAKGIEKTIRVYESLLRDKLQLYHGDKVDKVFEGWSRNWLSDAFENWNIFDSLAKISTPTLILQGENDRYATREHPEIIASKIPGNAKAELIPDADHAPHKENYSYLEATIQEFLKPNNLLSSPKNGN